MNLFDNIIINYYTEWHNGSNKKNTAIVCITPIIVIYVSFK